jgi:hypothetical protein
MKALIAILLITTVNSWAWDTSMAQCSEDMKRKGLCGVNAYGSHAWKNEKATEAQPAPVPVTYTYTPIEVQYLDSYIQGKLASRARVMSDPQWGTNPALLTHVERIDQQIMSYVSAKLK